jgi:predicted TPR repeat methyltransferase
MPGPVYLDIGCGYGKWGFLLRNYRGMEYPGALKITGVDLFQPHIDSLQDKGIYDELGAVRRLSFPLKTSRLTRRYVARCWST